MVKRKKRFEDFDSFEDFEDEQTAMEQAEPEVAKISLEDFVIFEKVSAFCRTYEPCDEFDTGAECFDDGRLREYFKAYVCGLGDPLAIYIEEMKIKGFKMVTSLAINEPCIFARLKTE